MRPTWPLTGRRPTAGSGGARAARWLRVPGVHMHPRSPGTARRPAGGRTTLGSPCSTALLTPPPGTVDWLAAGPAPAGARSTLATHGAPADWRCRQGAWDGCCAYGATGG